MLEDCCVICKSLKTEKIEIASAFKRGIEEIVSIKKINKDLCDSQELASIKNQIFSDNYIEEIETDKHIFRIEKNLNAHNEVMSNYIYGSEDGVAFFKEDTLAYINEVFLGMLNGDFGVHQIEEIEQDKVIKNIIMKIGFMRKESKEIYKGHCSFKINNEKKRYFLEITRTGTEGNVMVICKDRTKKYIAEKNLSNINQRLSAVLESSRSGVFEINDLSSEEIWISYDIYKILGYSMSRQITACKKIRGVVHQDDFDSIFMELKTSLINREIMCKELRIKDVHDTYRWFSIVAYSMKKEDGKNKIVGSITDIHDKKMASMDLKNSEKALEEERELNKLITEFFNNISHDFKTPLNLITNSLKLLRGSKSLEGKVDSQVQRYFDIIQQNSYRLIKLVNNLLDISRIESGFYSLKLNNGNIVSLIEDTTISVQEYTKNKGIQLIFDTDFEEEIICYDDDKIERVILNLLSNSIKFTDDGGRIDVKVSKMDEFVKVSISDDGIGIPKSKLNRIFDRFEQAHEIRTNIPGTGIGLALVKSLVELHKGKISIASEEGEGTEVTMYLPLRRIEEEKSKEFMKSNFDIDKVFVELSDVCQV